MNTAPFFDVTFFFFFFFQIHGKAQIKPSHKTNFLVGCTEYIDIVIEVSTEK